MPALLTSTSSLPKCLVVAATTAAQPSSWVFSALPPRLPLSGPSSGIIDLGDQPRGARRAGLHGLCAGGDWIQTCMGLFVSSSSFWFVAGFFVRSEKPFFVPSPAIRFPERAEGGKGPKRQQSSAACRLAALVFRSAPCSSQGQALTPEHAEGG